MVDVLVFVRVVAFLVVQRCCDGPGRSKDKQPDTEQKEHCKTSNDASQDLKYSPLLCSCFSIYENIYVFSVNEVVVERLLKYTHG